MRDESSSSPTRKARSTPSVIWSTIRSVIRTWTWTSGNSLWKATTIGASSESEMLGGAASRRFPETFERWLEAMLSIASLISAPRWAYSSTSEPTSVRRRERVDRSIKRTPSACSSSAMRRLTVEVGILRRRAAFEKPLASTTWAKMTSELRSDIGFPVPESHSTFGYITNEETHIVGSRQGSALGAGRLKREQLLIQIQGTR